MCRACDPRQDARAFNQPLSWDTSSVTNMDYMFGVRCSPFPLHPKLQSRPHSCTLCLHRDRAPYTPSGGGWRVAPHYTPCALLATRQDANSLSAANKLLIRCAWAGTPVFASAGYESSWAHLGSCPP